MPPAFHEAPARLASSLHEANNDTGRVAFCGPVVLSAITGYSVSKVEDEVRAFRNVDPGRKPVIRGTYTEEVAAALAHFGYIMELKDSFMKLSRKERPSLCGSTAAGGQKKRKPVPLRARHAQEERRALGADQGLQLCDTYTEGRWQFVCESPHKGARIMEVFEVRKALEV